MKKCECLRYESLRANRKNESVYVFVEDGLYSVESIFPLEDFVMDSGELITICPLYNYLQEGRLIPRAYDKMIERDISSEDRTAVLKAVNNCQNLIEVKKYLIFSERSKEILELFCEQYKIRMTWRLLKEYLKFFKERGKYKDDSLCKDVSVEEKKKCFDQLWVNSFREYLKNVKFNVPE